MDKIIYGIVSVPNYEKPALRSASGSVVVDHSIEIGVKKFIGKVFGRDSSGVGRLNLSSSTECDMCDAQLYIVPRGGGGVMGNLFYNKRTGQEGFLGSLPGPTESEVLSQASVLGFVERR